MSRCRFIGGNAFHNVARKLKELPRRKEVAPRIADRPTSVLRVRKIPIDELGKEPLRPVDVNAGVRGVELLHIAPYARTMLYNRYFESSHSLGRDVGNVLDVVEIVTAS
jgi:hypothetical protein